MPFLTQGKTSWKFIGIVVVLAVIVGGGIWGWVKIQEFPPVEMEVPEGIIEDRAEEWACGDNITFTYKGEEVAYGTVESLGKCWMDRNLGASQPAIAHNDVEAYGDLFQWGRLDDGHQARISGSTPILSNSDNPDHGDFILALNHNYGWREPQNDNLWQGVNGINNPCPDGWRIPTREEWISELTNWNARNYYGAFASSLKLTAGGLRHPNTVSLDGVGSYLTYWSSTVSATKNIYLSLYAEKLVASNELAGVISYDRAGGCSVRCIKN